MISGSCSVPRFLTVRKFPTANTHWKLLLFIGKLFKRTCCTPFMCCRPPRSRNLECRKVQHFDLFIYSFIDLSVCFLLSQSQWCERVPIFAPPANQLASKGGGTPERSLDQTCKWIASNDSYGVIMAALKRCLIYRRNILPCHNISNVVWFIICCSVLS